MTAILPKQLFRLTVIFQPSQQLGQSLISIMGFLAIPLQVIRNHNSVFGMTKDADLDVLPWEVSISAHFKNTLFYRFGKILQPRSDNVRNNLGSQDR